MTSSGVEDAARADFLGERPACRPVPGGAPAEGPALLPGELSTKETARMK